MCEFPVVRKRIPIALSIKGSELTPQVYPNLCNSYTSDYRWNLKLLTRPVNGFIKLTLVVTLGEHANCLYLKHAHAHCMHVVFGALQK